MATGVLVPEDLSLQSTDCASGLLTRHLEDVTTGEGGGMAPVLAAVLLSYLGCFEPGGRASDVAWEPLLDTLAEEGPPGFRANLRRPCAACPAQAGCGVGQAVLKD